MEARSALAAGRHRDQADEEHALTLCGSPSWSRRPDLPAGVFNVVTGDGVPMGDAIVKHPDVGIVSLTGEHDRRADRQERRRHPERVHLELGGKAPVIVFDDADVASTAE